MVKILTSDPFPTLTAIDQAIDDLIDRGYIKSNPTDLGVRRLWKWLRLRHEILPPPPKDPDPIVTTVLMLGPEGRRRMFGELRASGESGQAMTYLGIPIMVRDDIEGIRLVSLKPMDDPD